LSERLASLLPLRVELIVAGKIAPHLQQTWLAQAEIPILFHGQVPPEQIPRLDRSAHLLFSADLNAACPNSVIEALACGLPVAAFDTGALPELVQNGAGCIVPYGGDPWRLDSPDLAGLAQASAGILLNPEKFRQAARWRAEEAFGLETMVDLYLESLF
jgi:glycosyltransferase involved in cell wall biosynthesis